MNRSIRCFLGLACICAAPLFAAEKPTVIPPERLGNYWLLADTGKMAAIMGARTVVVGMRPEVAATLIRMGYQMEGVATALNVDDGLTLLAAWNKTPRRIP